MKAVIVIPARFGSQRLPGKPLREIAGKTMLFRVYSLAKAVSNKFNDIDVIIATDDDRIFQHVSQFGAKVVLTDANCSSGTHRTMAALQELSDKPNVVVSLQGDAPLTVPLVLETLIQKFYDEPDTQVATPVEQLTWENLDRLREQKKQSPFSGTTALITNDNRAIWFSKNIIPAIRDEDALRKKGPLSPVYLHIGVYGYSYNMLQTYTKLPLGHYEQLESLEQLRLLENGFDISAVIVNDLPYPSQSGIDTIEDINRAELFIAEYGEMI